MRAQDVLPDAQNEVQIHSTTVRKGTVGAFLANATAFSAPGSTAAQREAALQDIEEALPALLALGLFDILEIREYKLRAFVESRMAALAMREA